MVQRDDMNPANIKGMLHSIISSAPNDIKNELDIFKTLPLNKQIDIVVEESNAAEGSLTGYDCPICKNKGQVYYKHNGAFVSRACSCMQTRRSLSQLDRIGLGEYVRGCTFNTYEPYAPHATESKKRALEYTYEIKRGKWLFIGGQSGAGKTHLASAVLNHCIMELRISARAMRWVDDSRELKALTNYPLDYNAKVGTYHDCKMLLIDDFFKGEPTEADIKLARTIIDYRYINKKPTVITSELFISEIRAIDESIAGRIAEMSKGFVVQIKRDSKRNYRFAGSEETI